MRVNPRILLTCAFLAVVATFMALRPAPSCAIGNIHIIIVRSTTDPALFKAGNYWQERLEKTLESGKTPNFWRYGIPGAFEPATNPGGLGKNDVATYKVLEGDAADPDKICSVCFEVSMKAAPDDAIMVFIMSHGAVKKEDGVLTHVLAPTVTSSDDLEFGRKSIPRGTIFNALKVKKHRLIALITDSCASPAPEEDETPSAPTGLVKPGSVYAPVPNDTSYLKKFLQQAHGEININSCDYGQTVRLIRRCADDEFEGSLFINAFCRFATNGFYFDSELNPDDFCNLLRIEHEREIIDYNQICRKSEQNSLTQFNGSEPVKSTSTSFASVGEIMEFYNARKETISNSGKFKFAERTFPDATSKEPDNIYKNSIGMKFVRITSDGEFDMGCDLGPGGLALLGRAISSALDPKRGSRPLNREERLKHARAFMYRSSEKADIPREFYLAQCETTVAQFRTFALETNYRTVAEVNLLKSWNRGGDGANVIYWQEPGFSQSDDHPVVAVTRRDAETFCRWLSQKEGKKYRLPTEEEWEYCCRAGSNTLYWYGNDPDETPNYENVSFVDYDDSPYCFDDPFEFTSPVMSFKANPWNLYDMSGNVGEICLTRQSDKYEPVVRGASFRDPSYNAGSYDKWRIDDDDESSPNVGFRVLMEAQ